MILRNGDIQIFYNVVGKGTPIVFIEGLGYSMWMWKFQKTLSMKYKLIFYDNRGVGKSSKPEENYTLDDFQSDLFSLVQSLKLENFFLIGVSMGGMIAEQFALEHQEMIEGLVLSSTNFGIRSKLPSMDVLKILSEPPNGKEMFERMRPAFSEKTVLNNRKLIDLIIEERSLDSPIVKQVQQSMAFIKFDVLDKLQNISCPTLVISGLDDKIVPIENSEIIHEKLPNSKFIKFRDSGHLVNMERHNDYNAVIDKFCTSVMSKSFSKVITPLVI